MDNLNIKSGNPHPKLFFKFLRLLLPYWARVYGLTGLSLIIMLLGMINPFITKLVIDKAIPEKNLSFLLTLTAVGAGLFMLGAILQAASNYLQNTLNLKLGFDLRRRIIRHLNRLSLGFFQQKTSGELLYRINYDVDFISGFLSWFLPEAIEVFLRIIITVIIIFYLDRNLAWLSILLSPFLYLPSYYFNRRLKELFRQLNRKKENIYAKFIEVFSHLPLVKAMGKEAAESKRYLHRVIENLRLEIKNLKLVIAGDFIGSFVNRFIVGVIALYGGYRVIKGEVTLGSLLAIMMYLNQLMALQNSVVKYFRQINLGTVSCQRIDDILQEEPARTRARTRRFDFPKGEILFSDCTFGYKESALVLDKINFKIGSGSAVALVGPSGCGKTTIVNLILRLYEPLSGDIFIDGENIKDLDSSCLYNQIGVALQQPFLWNDTIENNIRYGKPDCLAEEIIHAAEITGLDILVKSLPEGYQTKVGEDAGKISQGQKQRIAISRAIIKRPKILILDEAMSSLDLESERKILDSLLKDRKGLATIIISHRGSVLDLVEKVYLIEGKDKITSGALAELRENPVFLRLFSESKEIE